MTWCSWVRNETLLCSKVCCLYKNEAKTLLKMAIEKSCTVQMTFEDCRANEGADIVKFSTTL